MLKQLAYGVATYVPGLNELLAKGTGGTNSARYCYSVWLRHLVLAEKSGLNSFPKIVAELGPGDSLGIGLAALISGSQQYFAFDVVKHANIQRNLSIFDELVTLFKEKTPIPGNEEWPRVKPQLDDYEFPSHILNENRLQAALEDARLAKIRNSIRQEYQHQDSMIQYKVPWYDTTCIESESVDMIYSQAVLEHVDDLKTTYGAMHSWLKPTGYLSHTIDFKCHGTAHQWNGHWIHSDLMWTLLRGKRPYLLNREPHSTHIKLIKDHGFSVTSDIKITSVSKYSLNQVAPQFRSFSQNDLVTSGTFIQATKKPLSHTVNPIVA